MTSNQTQNHIPPQLVMLNMICGNFITQAIYIVAKHNIADHIANGLQTADELAAKTGVHAQALHRLLRMLASTGIFAQTDDGRFELTPLAETLRPDAPGSMVDLALLMGRPMHWQTIGNLEYSIETGKPSFNHTWGVSLYDHCAVNPEDARIFNGAMSGFGEPCAAAVVQAYDFSGFRQLVDVGGGNGTYMKPFLNAAPNLRGVLFDRPHVADEARMALEQAGLADRCEVVGGDFFESVPAGGDVYVLADIIHNWPEEKGMTILRNIHQAMAEDGTLLLVEPVIPEGNEAFFAKQMDIVMLTLFEGGRERTEAEFRDLLARCGFELTRVVPTHSMMSVVEARRI